MKTFWSVSEDTGKLSIEVLDMYQFLKGNGFCKKTWAKDDIELFRKNTHLVEQCYKSDAINLITHYLKEEYKETAAVTVNFERKGPQTFEYPPKSILERIVKFGWGKIFNRDNYNDLPELEVNIKRHTKDKAFFYFKNGFVEVTAKGTMMHEYEGISGQYIYRDHLIGRDIQLCDINDSVSQDFGRKGYDFLDFLNRLAGIPMDAGSATEEQQQKLVYLLRAIGFLLHDYRQQGLTDYCVILCDDNIGGSGKGIIIQALRQMTALAEIDAKKDEQFDPEELTERTRIKVYNDIPPSFPFSSIYNEITDQAVIRAMYKSPRYVAYKDAWKVLLTSNHIVRGNTGADLRRQRVFSLPDFFNEKHTPREYYKHSFFSDEWNEHDWNFFYNTLFTAVKLWLASDYKIDYVDQDYIERKMEAEYPMEFRSYIDEKILQPIRVNGTQMFKLSDLYYGIKGNERYQLSPFVRKLNTKFFGDILIRYLKEIKVNCAKKHGREGIELTVWYEGQVKISE